MTRKREVRDARFRDREPKPKRPQVQEGSTGSNPPRGGRGGRSSTPMDDSDGASGPTPWWKSTNMIIPGVIAGLLGWALYEKYKPEPVPVAAVTSDAADASPAAAVEDASVVPAVAPAPTPTPTPTPPVVAVDAGVALDPNPVIPAHRAPSTPDPRGGHFTLAQATEGLAGDAPLHADIMTSMGAFDCELLSQQAPNTVANFVGLARGRRDFWDGVAGAWARRPFYNGSLFHRVIPDFMIQGGDLLRSGSGDPGYTIPDENVQGHNAAGQLCMANHGPNTSGGQFFITETAKPHLDGTYSIFGRCTPTDLVGRITHVARDANDRPHEPVYILRVDIRRGAPSAHPAD